MPDIAQITQYFNIGLLVLFLLIVIGLFLAGLRGFLRGVWKSTHNMIFMLSLVLISFFTLTVLTDFIGSLERLKEFQQLITSQLHPLKEH